MEQILIKLIEYYRMKVDRDHGYENNTPEYIVDDFINAQRENSNVSDNVAKEKECDLNRDPKTCPLQFPLIVCDGCSHYK